MTGRDRDPWIVVIGFTVLFFAAAVSHARARPLWHDEIVTVIVASQPTLRDVVRALAEGADLQPPLNVLLTRASMAVGGSGPVAVRLPAMAGVWVGCLVLFWIARRLAPLWVAATAAFVPCQSAVFRFAYEARGYGLLFGCGAVAVWAWLEAAAGRRRPGSVVAFGAATALATLAHYYAVLLLVPALFAELVRWRQSGRLDVPLTLSGAAGVVAAALVAAPLLRDALGRASTFWARAAGEGLSAAYVFPFGGLLDVPILVGLAVALGIAVAGAAARARRVAAGTMPPHEWMLVAGLAALPIVGLAAGRIEGGYTPRYGLDVVLGIALAIALGSWQLARRRARADLVVAATFLWAFATVVVNAFRPEYATFVDPYASRPTLREEVDAGRSVAVTGGLTFAQLWYYAPADRRAAIVYVADPAEALRATGSETIDRGLLTLSRWSTMQVVPYEAFLAAHDEFDLYAYGSGWLLDRVDADPGLEVTLDPRGDPGARLFRVRRKQK